MKKFLATLTSLLLVVTTGLAIVYRQDLKDYYIAHSSALSGQVKTIHDSILLTSRGSLLLRASRPQILDAGDFNRACEQVVHRHTIVLGCYTAQRIYIFNVVDSRLTGVKEVTAAHEMLHAAYERLSPREREELNKQLKIALKSINVPRVQDAIESYKKSGGANLENEIHSILGTEVAVLTTWLEDYYSQYFKDRSQIVALAAKYEDAFESLADKIEEYDKSLSILKNEKDSKDQQAKTLARQIESNREELDEYLSNHSVEEYNALVPLYNEQIARYNTLVDEIKNIVAKYNTIVEERNELAASQNDLVKQLDSSHREF